MAFGLGFHSQIETVFPVIELHNYLFRSSKKSLSELVVNNGINAGIVLPDIDWQKSRKYVNNSGQLSLIINDVEIDTGGLWPSENGPGSSLNWLTRNLKDFGLRLLPGKIVLAGTSLELHPVKDKDVVNLFVDDQLALACKVKIPKRV